MKLIMKLHLLILSIFLLLATESRRLIFIECITRHGVRYPSHPNQFDHSNISLISNAKSQLSQQGRKMHYILGRLIYKRYQQFFQKITEKNEFNLSYIYAKSTNTNRTIQSLQNLLFGLFSELTQLKKEQKFHRQIFPPFSDKNEDLYNDRYYQNWKKMIMIPIHVEKGAQGDPGVANRLNQGDFLVKQQLNLCPNQQKWQQANIQSSFVKSLMKSQQIVNSINSLRQFYGELPMDFNNVYKYVDNYKCLKAMGKDYLKIFEDPSVQQYLCINLTNLEFLYIARLYIVYLFTDKQIKTFSKSLLTITINNMKRAIDGSGPKLVFYSGHDITIAILLSAFNLTNIECIYQKYMLNQTVQNCYWQYPAFASSFIFQLWQEDNSVYNVQILINGKSYKLPFCDNNSACSLQEFQKWFINTTIKSSPNDKCGVEAAQTLDAYLQIVFSFSLGVLIPVILFLCFIRKRYKENVQSGSIQKLAFIDQLE